MTAREDDFPSGTDMISRASLVLCKFHPYGSLTAPFGVEQYACYMGVYGDFEVGAFEDRGSEVRGFHVDSCA